MSNREITYTPRLQLTRLIQSGSTALMNSVEKGDIPMVTFLLEKGADINCSNNVRHLNDLNSIVFHIDALTIINVMSRVVPVSSYDMV